MPSTKPLNLQARVSAGTKNKLRKLSKKSGMSMTAVIEKMVETAYAAASKAVS